MSIAATRPLLVGEPPQVQTAFLEFFAAQIRNRNTRGAYLKAVERFLAWCHRHSVTGLDSISPLHVAAWVEELTCTRSAATTKQHLAAVRMLFAWLAARQALPSNPAAHVKGPRHSTIRGKTPVLEAEGVRQLLDAIEDDRPIGRRDKALIGMMAYSFARVGAALALDGQDVLWKGRRLWLRLLEKGGRLHEMPCSHKLEDLLLSYAEPEDLLGQPNGPFFRSTDRQGRLTGSRLAYANAYAAIQRRARQAGLEQHICCHTFRATGITTYLRNGGTIERAAIMANHTSIRTTQLYDRRDEQITLDEVERVLF